MKERFGRKLFWPHWHPSLPFTNSLNKLNVSPLPLSSLFEEKTFQRKFMKRHHNQKGRRSCSFIWIVFISSSRHFEPNLKGSTPGKYLKWRPHHKNINFPLNFTLWLSILDLCQNHHNCWLCKKNNKSLEFSNWNEKLLLYTHTVDTG